MAVDHILPCFICKEEITGDDVVLARSAPLPVSKLMLESPLLIFPNKLLRLMALNVDFRSRLAMFTKMTLSGNVSVTVPCAGPSSPESSRFRQAFLRVASSSSSVRSGRRRDSGVPCVCTNIYHGIWKCKARHINVLLIRCRQCEGEWIKEPVRQVGDEGERVLLPL